MKNLKSETKKVKKPWPTKDAMNQVYEMNLWGSNNTKFYSGSGSHNTEIVKPYITVIKEFLTSFKPPITLCDLGCGDFNIGKELVKYTHKYNAVDIVSDLINHNKELFKDEKLTFNSLDIAVDELPFGDCALVRQVLQHLSNTEILSITKKLTNFKYIILTEHLPNGDFIPNKDIISGQGIRLKKLSGVQLTAHPFNLKIKKEEELLSIPLKNNAGVIVTTLYEIF